MKTTIENTPNAFRLLQSLRSSGYDNVSALCDLIDNAFDANADLVKVSIGTTANDQPLITIADNGDGMDISTLKEALKLGSDTKRADADLGKYGLGLITASISIAKRLVVITKYKGEYLTAIHDLDDVEAQNRFVAEIKETSSQEKNVFMENLGSTVSGTVLILQKVDNLQSKKNISGLTSSLVKYSGLIFRDFLSANKVITVNRKQVRPIDPMMRSDDETDELIDKEKEFVNDEGVKSTIRLRIFHLVPLSKPDNDALSDVLTINQRNQGFYLMRNNRQIARGENLGIFKKHNYRNRFRAEIYFDGSLDKNIGVNFKKQGIALHDEIKSWIELESVPQINAIYERARISGQKSKESKNTIDHTPTQRAISLKKSLIKKPKLEESINEKVTHSDMFVNVDFVDEHNTHLAPLFQTELFGKKLTIRYNLDHIFYQAAYLKESENKNLINALDSLVYSTALSIEGVIARSGANNKQELKDRFLDDLSDNLRSLLT